MTGAGETPIPPSGISRRKWAEAERAHPAVARMAEVQHAHGPVGGGADTGKPVDCPMALGDEHGEGVVGGQSRGAERSACGAGAEKKRMESTGWKRWGRAWRPRTRT